MSRYMQEVKTLVPMTVDTKDLVTLTEAAEILQVTVQAVAGAVDGGAFGTVIIDTTVAEGRGARGRRLLLRTDVMERMVERAHVTDQPVTEWEWSEVTGD